MKRSLTVVFLLLLAVGCSGGTESGGTEPPSGETAGTSPGETNDANGTTGTGGASAGATQYTEEARDLQVEQLSSGANGPEKQQIFIAPDAQELAAATGVEVPDAGEGAYLAVLWGEKPTGGYSVDFGSARLEGDRVIVRIKLNEPPPDAMVSQALTYPYATAVLRVIIPEGKNFSFVTEDGRELDWPVRSV